MGDSPVRIRVMIVDDHDVVRLGLRAFIDEVPDIEVIGDAADGQSALDLLGALAEREQLPDVVLMDLVMRGLDGIRTMEAIKQTFPEVEVIVVTSFGEAQRIHAALESGAAGYVLKDADVDEIAIAVRAAHRGEVHLDAAVARTLTRSLVAPGTGAAALTARERAVLVLVAEGKSNREIGHELVVSERTVQTHLGNILGKLGLTSRTQAALWAVREGIVPLNPSADRPLRTRGDAS